MSKYVMDIESTGLNIFKDDIIEISVLKLDSKYGIEDCFLTLLKSRNKLPRNIVDLTGITDELLSDRPYFSEVKKDLQCFLRTNTVYIYSRFEERFLVKRYGFKNKFIDVLNTVKRRFPDIPNYKLSTVLNRFKILYKPHRAFDDSVALSMLMKELRL